MASKDVLFVLGMGRSGSSALTRVLSLAGCTLPRSVLAPRDINPTGFWEPVDATKLNYEFLRSYGLPAEGPPIRLPVGLTCSESERENYISDVQRFLSSCSPASVLVLKCVGLTELMELWSEAACREELSVKVAIPLRHPREVFASQLAAKFLSGDSPEDMSNARWLRENLLAELQSRSVPRVFVEYVNLLRNWSTEIARVSLALSIDLKVDDVAIRDFLNRDLHRQQDTASPAGVLGMWASRVYEVLSAAARDEPLDTSKLDDIRRAFCSSEEVFKMLAPDQAVSDPHALREEMDRWPVWTAGRNYSA